MHRLYPQEDRHPQRMMSHGTCHLMTEIDLHPDWTEHDTLIISTSRIIRPLRTTKEKSPSDNATMERSKPYNCRFRNKYHDVNRWSRNIRLACMRRREPCNCHGSSGFDCCRDWNWRGVSYGAVSKMVKDRKVRKETQPQVMSIIIFGLTKSDKHLSPVAKHLEKLSNMRLGTSKMSKERTWDNRNLFFTTVNRPIELGLVQEDQKFKTR